MAQETLTTSYLAQLTNAKLYYISGGKSGGDKPAPTPDGGSDDGGSDDGGSDVPPVTPEPTPTPDPSGDGD